MFSVLILANFILFLKILGAPFVEQLPYITFNSVLTVEFLFWFVVTYQNCMCQGLEKKFLEILGAPRKKERCCFFRGAWNFETMKCPDF